MLPEISYIKSLLPNSFVYYAPKDIVSGDFYWISKKKDQIIISVADCTGHGVTGAFMSILGITALNEIVVEKNIVQTDQILNLLREKIIWTLQQGYEFNESKEGIEMVVCAIDLKQNKLQFSGAINSIFLVRNQEVLQYKGVGKWRDYLYGERIYIVLSFVAKTFLVWLVFVGLFRPF